MIIIWTCVELGFSYREMFAVKVNGEMKTRTREGYHPRQFLLDVLFIAHCSFFGWIRVYSKSLLKSFFTWEIFLSSLKGKGEKVWRISFRSRSNWWLRHDSWSRHEIFMAWIIFIAKRYLCCPMFPTSAEFQLPVDIIQALPQTFPILVEPGH